MSTETGGRADRGTGSWLLGGAVGGLVGSLLFGAVLWLVDPEIVTETIPAIYGLEPGSVGWVFHLAHGLVLGVVFGFLVTRDPFLGTLSADVETGFIAAMGLRTRFALAGLVYGLAVWTLLPLVAETIWNFAGVVTEPTFPAAGGGSLVGHLLYGLVLGTLFSVFVSIRPKAAETTDPFEESARE